MKRALLLLAFGIMTSVGCQTHSQRANNNCGPGGHGQYAACGAHGCGARNSADYVPQIPHHNQQVGPAGPPSAAYAYPYYTTRGPRDFFLDNPSTIGY